MGKHDENTCNLFDHGRAVNVKIVELLFCPRGPDLKNLGVKKQVNMYFDVNWCAESEKNN